MLKNYFIIALRHLTKHKLFSVINIFCLAIGISFFMLIGNYVLHEESVNANIRNINNQYILKSNWKVKEMGLDVTTIGPLAKTLREEYPGLVANYYRYNPVTNVVSAGDNHYKEDIAIGDTSLVAMYGFPLLYGNKQKAFDNNSSAVITEAMAVKLFGTANAINKTITVQTTVNSVSQDYKVSGVLKNLPYNSVTGYIGDNYNVFLPTESSRYYTGGDPSQGWANVYEVGMIELAPGKLPEDLAGPINQLLTKYAANNISKNLTVELSPIKDYYLKGGARQMITTLSLVAFFILLMAIINFININIGTSAYRLKEIGLRKVFGSSKISLIVQYITESILLSFIASVIAVTAYEMMRPFFNGLLNTSLDSIWQFGFTKIFLLLALVITVGFVAGIYPAFVLSSYKVVNSVKGKIGNAANRYFLRKGLLVVQFVIAIVVFVCALNISSQVSYFFKKDIGYNKDQVLVLTAFPKQWDSTGVAKMESVKKGLQQLPAVRSASLCFEIPERKPPGAIDLLAEGSVSNRALNISVINADEDYAATLGMQMAQGSFFQHHQGAYIPGQIVLNESAAKALALGDAVGKKITMPSSGAIFTVAGVVKDFNYTSLQQGIEPVAFINVKDALTYRFLTVKLAGGDNVNSTLASVKAKWKSLSPTAPFEYFFMDDKFQALYKSELQLKKAASVATILNLVIVFMGIFGIVAFTLTRRTKEIAMRKVLGANIPDIILLFIKDYAVLILIANIIAWPLAYAITGKWLEQYAYRINQGIEPFLIVALFTFLTAFVLISLQCFKVASSKPVDSLKYE